MRIASCIWRTHHDSVLDLQTKHARMARCQPSPGAGAIGTAHWKEAVPYAGDMVTMLCGYGETDGACGTHLDLHVQLLLHFALSTNSFIDFIGDTFCLEFSIDSGLAFDFCFCGRRLEGKSEGVVWSVEVHARGECLGGNH